jgi:hypothetical protein
MLAAGIDPKVCELGPKDIALRIEPTYPCRTEHEFAALIKMISRILNQARQ